MNDSFGFRFAIGDMVCHVHDDTYRYVVLEQVLTILQKGVERDYIVRWLNPNGPVSDDTILLSEFELRTGKP